jgi:hypothetical protein
LIWSHPILTWELGFLLLLLFFAVLLACLLLFVFIVMVLLYSPGLPGAHDPFASTSPYWDYRQAPPHPVCFYLFDRMFSRYAEKLKR